MKADEHVIRISTTEKGLVLWFAGPPSSGKTTSANVMSDKLKGLGMKVEPLGGNEGGLYRLTLDFQSEIGKFIPSAFV